MEALRVLVTFPHMGNVFVCVKALLDDLDVPYIIPPKISRKTLEFGARHAPEGVCMPLKITTGSLMQARELGADTSIMLGSWGPCRFGYYCRMQQEILEDAGCAMNGIILEATAEGFGELLNRIRRLTGEIKPYKLLSAVKNAAQISVAVDELERLYYIVKPRERQRGQAGGIYSSFLEHAHTTQGSRGIKNLVRQARSDLGNVPLKHEERPLRIGIVGEIFDTIDSYSSMELQDRLAAMGIETKRLLTISLWVVEHMLKKALHLPRDTRFAQVSRPYIGSDIGGHTRETLGHTILHAMEGFDGVIQLYPLGCMPEIVAQSILPLISRDYDIPLLTIIMDEMSGENGYMTRIEAFVDLLMQRRKKNKHERNGVLH